VALRGFRSGNAGDALWLSMHGVPMTNRGIYIQIVARTRKGLESHHAPMVAANKAAAATKSREVPDGEAITCGAVSSPAGPVVRWKLQFGQSPHVVAASRERFASGRFDLLLSSGVD